MITTNAQQRLEQTIHHLCAAGYDSQRLRLEVIPRLLLLIPADAYYWATTDPDTLLPTSAVAAGLDASTAPLFWQNEFEDDDVNRFAVLARQRVPVGHLFATTTRARRRSVRQQELLPSLGLGDELRAALMIGGQCWGLLMLNRARDCRPFSQDEGQCLARLVPHLAAGLRAAMVQTAVRPTATAGETGFLLLAPDNTVLLATTTACDWLAELVDYPRPHDLPNAIVVTASRLRSLLAAGATAGDLPQARVRTASGRWLTLRAVALTEPGSPGAIALLLEPTQSAAVATLLLQAHGLTTRESQIMQLVLQGQSTTTIANTLSIAAPTVQQHFKAIFRKTGVRSRRELVAHLFNRYPPPALI